MIFENETSNLNVGQVFLNFKKETLLVGINGDIDHHTAQGIREQIDESINSNLPKLVYIDLKNVSFMDSSGIGLIIGRFKLITNLSGKLKVINIPERLQRMIKLSGLLKLGIF
ncbi:MAG: anti-sigma factor antagonist [Candidatus Paraimprobicoccus trichonymphae]|uniref:Anti-sigma factor antagonist n=1 Tax=Candidatus Paraimprobicoccus trichonymphae TaxID=3033793 RepID=A0AA48IAL8_9FIRM|nr:MAG: anti-sigma factor antagonist [Candidatus Paraimprobicoccus trichonymphae]